MIRCIIVDDEPLAREVLVEFAGKVPFLETVSVCSSGYEALEVLKNETVDLIFLDIQMPDITGMQLYNSLSARPMVIFTTAYSDYAVEGFEVDAVDYLVKPFSFERFLKAVNKANDLTRLKEESHSVKPENDAPYIFIKDGNKTVKINLDDILYLEGMKDYVKIVLSGRSVLTLISMQKMLEKLPSARFIRIHRSYIVPLAKIDTVERNRVVIGDKWIPVGNMYKEDFFKRLGYSS